MEKRDDDEDVFDHFSMGTKMFSKEMKVIEKESMFAFDLIDFHYYYLNYHRSKRNNDHQWSFEDFLVE